jgi:hypothetical protein
MYPTTGMPLAVGDDQTLQLLEEIATLESRLEDMGLDGDCAYERAMSRLYADMVEERKRRLAALHRSRLP